MPEDIKETKAQKLAAARKKLKEFQKRNHDPATQSNTTTTNVEEISGTSTTTGSIASNLSERSESEINLNGHHETRSENADSAPIAEAPPATVSTNYFESATTVATEPLAETYDALNNTPTVNAMADSGTEHPTNINAIQLLIAEKSQLTAELNKYRSVCRERDLELEELRTQYTSVTQRVEELQQRYLEQQKSTEQLRKTNAELQHKLAQSNAQHEDQQTHVNELQKQLTLQQTRANELDQQYLGKCNELEMSQLRIRQLTDESNISTDNRVETLTQTQYMYEQQIRDLQAMLQQLTHDKEQANTQYQNYVQHLNTEVTKLSERNAELSEECEKQQERERQLVEHVSGLEKEIQRNINKREQYEKIQQEEATINKTEDVTNELEKLKTQISDNDFERHEFQLKIKSQEDKLHEIQQKYDAQCNELEQIKQYFEHLSSEQPDKTKLLATMESDKIAASRALTQNVEMKKQLDELEIRFVQLTNDKAELMNKLDAEEYANREVRTNYEELKQRLSNSDERFKFKDEEMIRLSHENVELSRQNVVLQQQLENIKHYEVKGNCEEPELSSGSHDHKHDHENEYENELIQQRLNMDTKTTTDNEVKANSLSDEAGENEALITSPHSERQHTDNNCSHTNVINTTTMQPQQQQHSQTQPYLPTSEAVEKLQVRFTQLISQVADLTDEKQRLEHLVLQLQGETETIGEYITLYQTQRRMLKQREYEKAAQMQMLEEERTQLREKIFMLNNLVSSLGVVLPQQREQFENATATRNDAQTVETRKAAESIQPKNDDSITNTTDTAEEIAISQKLNTLESKQILNKIHNIITEIKENTKEVPTVQHSVDHLNCCLGKFEVV